MPKPKKTIPPQGRTDSLIIPTGITDCISCFEAKEGANRRKSRSLSEYACELKQVLGTDVLPSRNIGSRLCRLRRFVNALSLLLPNLGRVRLSLRMDQKLGSRPHGRPLPQPLIYVTICVCHLPSMLEGNDCAPTAQQIQFPCHTA